MAVVERFLQPPAGSFLLFGPRGTGKSTWLGQAFPDALRQDLLAPEVLRSLQARPERLAERIAAAPPGLNAVVIDEIQKAPQLLDVVHGLVEQRRVERSDLKALQAFGEDYPEAERRRLSFCPEPLLIDGIRCEPLETWLRQLRP